MKGAKRERALFVVKFFLAGIPAFGLSVGLNWLLVSTLGIHPGFAYAIVLPVQMTVNFLISRRYVFKRHDQVGFWGEFGSFLVGNGLIRAIDWAVYTVAVAFQPRWYLGFQVLNLVLFSFAKFFFSNALFKGKHFGPT